MLQEREDSARAKMMASTSLERVLECPVCLDVVKPPVQQCSNGHVTCSACVQLMTPRQCALCTQPFCVENSIFVKNLLEALPRVCQYSEMGCKAVSVPGEDDHENFCGFRSIKCRSCQVKVQLRGMVEHYEENHATTFLVRKCKQNMVWPDFDPCKDVTTNTPIFIYDHFFYVCLRNDASDKTLKITCDAFYVGKPEANYYLSVKFENGDFVQHKTIRPVTMKGEIDSDGLTMISATEENVKAFCMHVPQEFLCHFVSKENKLVNS